jgi:hypothetical protein
VGRDTERLEAVAKIASSTARTVLIHEADLAVDGAIDEAALAQLWLTFGIVADRRLIALQKAHSLITLPL